jgi:hypothetical protein
MVMSYDGGYYSDTDLYEIEAVLRRWHASKSQHEIIAAMCQISEMKPEEYARKCRNALEEGLTELRREKNPNYRKATNL